MPRFTGDLTLICRFDEASFPWQANEHNASIGSERRHEIYLKDKKLPRQSKGKKIYIVNTVGLDYNSLDEPDCL